MATKQVTLSLTDEARAIIEGAATERKRGEWVSGIVVDWAERQANSATAMGGILERIEARLARIEGSINSSSTGGSK